MFSEAIKFVNDIEPKSALVMGVYADGTLTQHASKLDTEFNGEFSGVFTNLVKKFGPFKRFDTKVINFAKGPDMVLVGLGEPGEEFSRLDLEKLGAAIYSAVKGIEGTVTVVLNKYDIKTDVFDRHPLMAFGALLKSWKFDTYKSENKKDEKIQTLAFLVTKDDAVQFDEYKNLVEAIFLTRKVVSEPANVIYPDSLAHMAERELIPLNVQVEIYDEINLEDLNMNAILGVGKGSVRPPRVVVMRWTGTDFREKPIAFVGKGITFDSGGISLKPADGMEDMRHDMAGAGAVLGLMKAIALNKLNINVVGVMALAENMPSGSAQHPGDIITSASGQTIEVLNTDAEGRLVLADALWYIIKKALPSQVIDLATLTGAIVVALGHEFAGLFSNDDSLAAEIEKSAKETGEKVWRMPMSEHFDKGINSDIADMQNIGRPKIRGGSITAAQFLKRFVGNTSWAHIDIAGVETATSNDLFFCSNGDATAFGVHLLYNMLLNKLDK